MEEKLYLYIPRKEELSYREKIMSQADTMSYNKNYDMNLQGYHKDTGCIDFPKESWAEWYDEHVNNKPKSYYAYIARKEDNEFIGEVNLRWNSENDWYEMGIIIESKYRNIGYSKESLKKLLEVAFVNYNALSVYNSFENTREEASKVHEECGFKLISRINGFNEMLITRSEYLKLK